MQTLFALHRNYGQTFVQKGEDYAIGNINNMRHHFYMHPGWTFYNFQTGIETVEKRRAVNMIKNVLAKCKRVVISNKKGLVILSLMVGLAVVNVWVYNSKREIYELQSKTEALEKRITEANVKLDSVVEFTYKSKDLGLKIDELTNIITKLQTKVRETSDQQSKDRKVINQISRGGLVMRATAYDLTVESCGKRKSHPEYGVTRTGTIATKGRTVAVDPKTIPLGSKLYIKFPEKYRRLDGTYIAEDTGSAVKNDIIDIFLGEEEDEVDIFGIQKVTVYVTRRGWEKKG